MKYKRLSILKKSNRKRKEPPIPKKDLALYIALVVTVLASFLGVAAFLIKIFKG